MPVFTCSFCEPFIDKFLEHIDAEYIAKGKGVVFGEKRPGFIGR